MQRFVGVFPSSLATRLYFLRSQVADVFCHSPACVQVKVATDTETNTNYAIKIVDKAQLSTKGLEARLKREIAVMKVVRHPHVVNLIEARGGALVSVICSLWLSLPLAGCCRCCERTSARAPQVLASKSSVFIVMEFVTGGDLLDYITAHRALNPSTQ